MSADGYVTKTGTFVVAGVDRTFSISLPKICSYTFDTTANVVVKDSAGAVVDPSDGKTYQLAEGSVYTWTATADGFVGKSNTVTAAAGGGTVTAALVKAPVIVNATEVTGGQTISKGGTYTIKSGSTGTITVDTSEAVILVGTGISSSDVYRDLTIDCVKSGANLTIQDLFISNANWSSVKDTNLYLYLTGGDHTLTVNGETFTATWNSGTSSFTVAKSNLNNEEVTATVTLDVKVSTSGKTSTATVSSNDLTSAVSDAITQAKKDGTDATDKINIDAPETSTTVKTILPAAALSTVANSEIASLTLSMPIGSITLDSRALDSVAGQAKGTDGTLSVAKVDKSTLSKAQQAAVGDSVVIDLGILSGTTQIHNFGSGSATVRIPYTLKNNETADGS